MVTDFDQVYLVKITLKTLPVKGCSQISEDFDFTTNIFVHSTFQKIVNYFVFTLVSDHTGTPVDEEIANSEISDSDDFHEDNDDSDDFLSSLDSDDNDTVQSIAGSSVSQRNGKSKE